MNKQKSKDQCPDCKDVVKEEDLALSCDLCLKWYHINCQSVGKVVYNFLMKKNSQIHWFCKNCDGHAITSLKIIQDVHQTVQHIQEEVNQLKSSNSDILNRLSKLENSGASQITKSDKYNNVKVSELEKKIESIDITQRTMNLIFTKLSEPQIEEGGNYVTEERRLVQGVLNKLELESLDFDICGRIGIKRNDTRRPLRVRVKKITEKIDILKKAPKLRLIDEYRDMYISQDLTPEQQTAGKLLRDELKQRISNGEVNLRIRRGKIIPIQRDN